MKSKILSKLFYIAVLLHFQACDKDEMTPEIDTNVDQNSEYSNYVEPVRPISNIPAHIRQKLENIGFTVDKRTYRYGDYKNFEGTEEQANKYVVEGDMLISETQMDAMLVHADSKDETGATEKIYRYKNWLGVPVDGSQATIKVHITNNLSAIKSEITQAMQRFNVLNLGFKFVETSDINKAQIKVKSSLWQSELGLTDLPEAGTQDYSQRAVDNPGMDLILRRTLAWTFLGKRKDLVSLIAHEFGHAVGLLHTEHDNAEIAYCTAGEASSTVPPSQYYAIDGTSSIRDEALLASFMQGCLSGKDRPFTMADKIGLYNLFGRNINGGDLLIKYHGVNGHGDIYTTDYNGFEYTTSDFDGASIMGRIPQSTNGDSRLVELEDFLFQQDGKYYHYLTTDEQNGERDLGYVYTQYPGNINAGPYLILVEFVNKSNPVNKVYATEGFQQLVDEGFSFNKFMGFLAPL